MILSFLMIIFNLFFVFWNYFKFLLIFNCCSLLFFFGFEFEIFCFGFFCGLLYLFVVVSDISCVMMFLFFDCFIGKYLLFIIKERMFFYIEMVWVIIVWFCLVFFVIIWYKVVEILGINEVNVCVIEFLIVFCNVSLLFCCWGLFLIFDC